MNVLFVSNDPSLFDVESPTCVRMQQYAASIGQLHIVSQAPKGAVPQQIGPLFLHPVPGGWLRFRRLKKEATRIVREYAIDVVSAQDPFEHGRIALQAIAGTSARLHLQVHTDFLSPWFREESWKNKVRVRIAESVLPKAHAIRTVSARVRDSLIDKYGVQIVVPSVIPIAPSHEAVVGVAFPPHTFTFVLFAVGRLEPEKRFEDLLNALALVLTKYPRTGLCIAGSGRKERELRKLVQKLGLTDYVVFLGNRPDARGLMHNAHAFIQASSYEGYGRTLVEAALAQIPVITTNTGIVGEVFRPDRDVLACTVGDVSCLAGQICRLIEDNQLRRVLSVNAEAAVLAHLAAYPDLPRAVAEDLARAGVRNPVAAG